MLSVTYFDYFPVTKKIMLYKHPHTLCDGVIVEKDSQLFLYFANAQQHHKVSTQAILTKLGKVSAEASENLGDLFEFLQKKRAEKACG